MERDNITHNEHYIPQFFIKQFYATETRPDKNMKQGMVCCYDLPNTKQHPAHSPDVFWEEDLYETAFLDENVANLLRKDSELETCVNYFENEFCKIEKEAGKYFKKLLFDCNTYPDKSTILSCSQVNYFIKYIVLQLLRTPQYLEMQIEALDEAIFKGEKMFAKNSSIKMTEKHYMLREITTPNSLFVNNIYKFILFNHDICVFRLNTDDSFFSSNVPVFLFDYTGCGNIFENTTIAFPISPKYCITLLRCEYKKHKNINKKLIYVDKKVYDGFVNSFVMIAGANHNKIFSDSISNELIEKLQILEKHKLIYDKNHDV